MTERRVSPEARAAMAEAKKRAWADPERRARMSAAVKRALADPEVRARISDATRRAMAAPEVRARIAAAKKRAWADPERRARMLEANRRTRAQLRGFAVPGWVSAAGLEDDFAAVARERGEEAAASFCRALKRAMAVPA